MASWWSCMRCAPFPSYRTACCSCAFPISSSSWWIARCLQTPFGACRNLPRRYECSICFPAGLSCTVSFIGWDEDGWNHDRSALIFWFKGRRWDVFWASDEQLSYCSYYLRSCGLSSIFKPTLSILTIILCYSESVLPFKTLARSPLCFVWPAASRTFACFGAQPRSWRCFRFSKDDTA